MKVIVLKNKLLWITLKYVCTREDFLTFVYTWYNILNFIEGSPKSLSWIKPCWISFSPIPLVDFHKLRWQYFDPLRWQVYYITLCSIVDPLYLANRLLSPYILVNVVYGCPGCPLMAYTAAVFYSLFSRFIF